MSRIAWLVVAFLCNAAVLVLWACRWRVLLPRSVRVGFGRLLECASYSAFAMNVTPFAGGLLSSTLLLAHRAGAGNTAAVSTTAVDVLAEGVIKVAVVLIAIAFAPVPSWIRDAAFGVVGVVALLAVALALLARYEGDVLDAAPVRSLARRIGAGLEAMREPRRLAAGMGIIALMKVAEAAAILCVQRGFGVELPLTTLPLVLSAVMLATMVPIVPGNFGIYESAAFLVYQQLGVPPETAMAIALTQHVALLAAFGAASGIALLASYPRNDGLVGVMRTTTIWASLLSFAIVVGVLALLRGFFAARSWRRMTPAAVKPAPRVEPTLRRSG